MPLSADKTQVMLISSTTRAKWVIPKGGWETDETEQQAAARESWEEAGIICHFVRDLGWISEQRSAGALTKDAPKAAYRFFEVTVGKIEEQWPEMHKRSRMWMSYSQAATALKDRPELLEALHRSSVLRN